MDNDNKDQPDSDEQIKALAAEADGLADQASAPKAKQKSGGGLSLLVSILALGGMGYLLYKDFNESTKTKLDVDGQRMATLSNQNAALESELKALNNEIVALKNAVNGHEQKLAKMAEQAANDLDAGATAFDNSINEAALNEINTRLAAYQANLQQMTRQVNLFSEQSNNSLQSTVPELQPDIDEFNTKATLETLMVTELLLANNQLSEAINGLSSHLSSANIQPQIRTEINRLVEQLRSVVMPDTGRLTEQLIQTKTEFSALQIPTVTAETEESHWYDRFISVKKISADNTAIGNSAFLAILKSQLNNHMLQAELALIMQNQNNWQLQLQAASQLLEQQLPNQSGLIGRLSQLADEPITPTIPVSLNIQGLINDLKGFRR